MRFPTLIAAVLAVSVPLSLAQTSTDCNPTEKSCPSDTGLDQTTFTSDFTQGSSANASWSAAAYTTINYGSQGAEFTISKAGEAPTIETDFYFFFGYVEVKMKAAPGQGIVSSIVLESDDLDEIDLEFLGGNTAQVETNYFGKGNTTTYNRAIYYSVETPQDTFHTYAVNWTSESIVFLIDGTAVRTLEYADALGGQNYPQTPMRLKLGNWAGGAPGEPAGTVEWAGGATTFSDGPFTMYVESVSITNYNPGSEYEYTDETGSYESIKVVDGGNSSTTGSSSSASTAAASSSGNSSTGNAPTSSQSVADVINTAAAVSSTVTGSAYSTNTAAISSANATIATGGSAATSVVAATTEVPGSSPSSTGSSGASGSNATAATSSGPAQQTSSSGANSNAVVASGSLFALAMGFWML